MYTVSYTVSDLAAKEAHSFRKLRVAAEHLLYEAVHRDGVAVFSNSAGPTDIHFSADGHALVAEWLHRELPAAFARSAAAY